MWWTGDVVYTQLLDNVQKMVNGGLNLQPYVHPDCGAHYGVPFLEETPEMFVRWAQFCSMGTIIRFHTNNCCDHRPWSWGKKAEDAIRKTLQMRYALMPTLIAAGRGVTADGSPLVKRLDLEWPELGAAGASRDDQYLLADDILVAPVIPFNSTGNITNGTANSSRSVWVPPGSWADAWSSVVVKGPTTIAVKNVPMDQIPMWHRMGSILITTAPMGSTVAQNWSSVEDPLTLDVFPFSEIDVMRSGDGAATATRFFYDTKTNASQPPRIALAFTQRASTATTPSRTTPSAHSLTLSIGEGPARLWRVRVHLLPGETIESEDLALTTSASHPNGQAATERVKSYTRSTERGHGRGDGESRRIVDGLVNVAESETREIRLDLVFHDIV